MMTIDRLRIRSLFAASACVWAVVAPTAGCGGLAGDGDGDDVPALDAHATDTAAPDTASPDLAGGGDTADGEDAPEGPDVVALDVAARIDAAPQDDVVTPGDVVDPEDAAVPADTVAPDTVATPDDTAAPDDVAEPDDGGDPGDVVADASADTASADASADAASADAEVDAGDGDAEADAGPVPLPTHCTLTKPLTFGQKWPVSPATAQIPPGTGCALPGWPGQPAGAALSFSPMTVAKEVGEPGFVTRCLVVEDLNGDGLDDLAYVTPAPKWTEPVLLHVHYQKAGGGFSSKAIELSGTDKVYGCTTADLMGNGNVGLIIANELGVTVAAPSWGGSWIVFAPNTNTEFNYPVLAVASGDFNRDGKTDFVTAAALEPEWSKPLGDCTCGPAPDSPYTKCEGGFCTAWNVEYRVHLRQGIGYTSSAALTPMVGEPWSLSVHDLDRDGWPDLFVGAEWGSHGWYRNNGDDSFSLVTTSVGMRPWAHIMGAAVEDFDLDGRFDVFAVDYGVDTLYRAVGDDQPFENASAAAGLFKHWNTAVTWSATAADFDSDGWLDVFAANSAAMTLGSFWTTINPMNPPFQNVPESGHQVWHNTGGAFTASVVPHPPGLKAMVMPARASAGDLDADGDLDVALVEWDGSLRLLQNDTPQGGQLRVRLLTGKNGAPRLDGAWVEVWAEGHVQTRYVTPSRGHNTGPGAALVFGLGSVVTPDVVRVTWADGAVSEVWKPTAGETIAIEAPQPLKGP